MNNSSTMTRPALIAFAMIVLFSPSSMYAAEKFEAFLQPIFKKHCVKCHGEDKEDINGEVNLFQLQSLDDLAAKPEMLKNVIEVLDANDMPPEDEPQINPDNKAKLISSLKHLLRESTANQQSVRIPARRLNRFQYNNAIKDLFKLNKDIFFLPEKLMTRQANYLQNKTGKMPDRVNAFSHSLSDKGGFKDVEAFPQDLRAEHGFDNQADHLSLSPILLDSFLRLSVSILNSPDFNEQNCGIWQDFFEEPDSDSNLKKEVQERLKPFLESTFRSSIDDETLNRYTDYVIKKKNEGLSFTDSMKKGASAALSSPLFLYRYKVADEINPEYELASKLSFFLWGSIPDKELLNLAKSGRLSEPDVLQAQVKRMLADQRIERFLDSFPSQWMHLQSVFGARPDTKLFREYSLDQNNPASLHMVIEPLLLFDAIFVEDRPLIELISPEFSYQSDFLKDWYSPQPSKAQKEAVAAADQKAFDNLQSKRMSALQTLEHSTRELKALIDPVKEKLLAAKKNGLKDSKPVDLKPYAAWEFDGDLQASISNLHLKSFGDITYEEGKVVLNESYLKTENLPIEVNEKSLEVWIQLNTLEQSGGGAMTIEEGGKFDAIVFGEKTKLHWLAGSNNHARTLPFPESYPETETESLLHLVMVYQEDGTTTFYRNGQPYGLPFNKRKGVTYSKDNSFILFGLRHLPANKRKHFSMKLDKARFYTRALTAEEVAASSSGSHLFISNQEVLDALTADQLARKTVLEQQIKESKQILEEVPEPNLAQIKRIRIQKEDDRIRNLMRSHTFHRVRTTDPRYGGILTNAAVLTMTSSPKRTLPIARGVWVIEVLFNDPPPPPPNDVPPLNEEQTSNKLTIREKFAQHRENPSCASCHSRLDPLGFALENFDVIGKWRDKYDNGRDVDASGSLMKQYPFQGIVDFKESLVKEEKRFAKAFTSHLLRFALSRELTAADSITVEDILSMTEKEKFKLKSIITQVIMSDTFLK